MKKKEKKYKVNRENYFLLASIIGILFILMMAMVNLNSYIRKNKENSKIETNVVLRRIKQGKMAELDATCIIVAGKGESHSIEIVEGSLEKAKISYISKVKFEDITQKELQSSEIIIISGSEYRSMGNMDIISEYVKKGKHIIFTSMPDVGYVEASGLKKIMGIRSITESQHQEGVEFLQGFMLGGLLEFPKLQYKAPEVQLLSTTKKYVVGSKKSAVIWRNTYNKSEIYVVNAPFFETNAGYGILSAIMAQIYTDYIYPVVNAKVYTYTGLPYVNYENTSKLQETYSRDAMQLQQDILIPDILSINKSRSFIPSGFITDEVLKGSVEIIKKYSEKQINNYQRDIYKIGGEVGVVYSGDLEKDTELYSKLFNNSKFKSIRCTEGNIDDLNKIIDKEKYSFVQSVFGPWELKKKSFGYITESAVYVPFTISGIENSDLEKLEFYSGITAFGAIIQNLDLEQIVYPKGNKDNWMNVSSDYIKFIDSYRKKFEMIKSRNITEAAQSVKKFEVNSPSVAKLNNKIEFRFKEWYGESYYILRTNKEVESVLSGTVEKIEEGVYLVTANNKEVDIILRQIKKYK